MKGIKANTFACIMSTAIFSRKQSECQTVWIQTLVQAVHTGKEAGKEILTHKGSPIICSRRQFQILLLNFSKLTNKA